MLILARRLRRLKFELDLASQRSSSSTTTTTATTLLYLVLGLIKGDLPPHPSTSINTDINLGLHLQFPLPRRFPRRMHRLLLFLFLSTPSRAQTRINRNLIATRRCRARRPRASISNIPLCRPSQLRANSHFASISTTGVENCAPLCIPFCRTCRARGMFVLLGEVFRLEAEFLLCDLLACALAAAVLTLGGLEVSVRVVFVFVFVVGGAGEVSCHHQRRKKGGVGFRGGSTV